MKKTIKIKFGRAKLSGVGKAVFVLSAFFLVLIIPFGTYAQNGEASPRVEPAPEVLPETQPTNLGATEKGDPVADATEPELISEVVDETEATPEVAADEEFSELMIHVEQLGWNSFRLRPSFRLGVSESEYLWSFGDGTNSGERFVEHQYEKPGMFLVELGVIDENGTPHSATIQVGVGFFHLANWRLWVLIGLLALIIIVAAIIAGVTGSIVSEDQSKNVLKKSKPSQGSLEESPLASLSEESGDLDVLASTGLEAGDLTDELALLEALDDTPVKKIVKPVQAVEPKPVKLSPTNKATASIASNFTQAKVKVESVSVPMKPSKPGSASSSLRGASLLSQGGNEGQMAEHGTRKVVKRQAKPKAKKVAVKKDFTAKKNKAGKAKKTTKKAATKKKSKK